MAMDFSNCALCPYDLIYNYGCFNKEIRIIEILFNYVVFKIGAYGVGGVYREGAL